MRTLLCLPWVFGLWRISKVHRYFAYGSNLHPRRLGARVAIAADLGRYWLPGWCLRFHKRGRDGSGKGTIVPGAPHDGVVGAVYLLDDAARQALDRIEGVGQGYRVEALELSDLGHAFCYIAETSYLDPTLRPFDWYLALVRAGACYRGAPATYLAALDGLPVLVDPDLQRAAAARAVIAE